MCCSCIHLSKWVSANVNTWFAINNNPQLSSSSTTIIYDVHQCCITTFTHGHHHPQHSLTANNDHGTLQHNDNTATHVTNQTSAGKVDMTWRALSGCFWPPRWVNNHLAPHCLLSRCHIAVSNMANKWTLTAVDNDDYGHHDEQPPCPPMPRCHVTESNMATKQQMATMDGQCGNTNNDEGPPTNSNEHTQCSDTNGNEGPTPPLTNGDEDPPPPCTNGNECPAPAHTHND